MKRTNGLDKEGNPMTVRGGVFELLKYFSGKKMLILYSHGLHHVLPPGKKFPKLFKKIEAKIESLGVDDYLRLFMNKPDPKDSLCRDLERRRDLYC